MGCIRTTEPQLKVEVTAVIRTSGIPCEVNAMALAIIEGKQFRCHTMQYDTIQVLQGVVNYTIDGNSPPIAPSHSPKLLSPLQSVSRQASPNTNSTLTKVCSYQT
jgi:hypothetical protein